MTTAAIIIPISTTNNLPEFAIELTKALQNNGINAGCFQPTNKITISHVNQLLAAGNDNELLEEIYALYKNEATGKDVVIIQGIADNNNAYLFALNKAIAQAMNAKVIFLTNSNDAQLINIYTKILENTTQLEVAGHITDDKPISSQLNQELLAKILDNVHANRISATQFRYQLITQAQAANRTIVLPESSDPRILTAASICARRKIANCILLGKKDEIVDKAAKFGIEISSQITIIDPETIANNYVDHLVQLRKSKGLTHDEAKNMLQDSMVVATMMLENNEVDGIVSGAINTTANTIRPALQIIKTSPGMNLVSSIFFMCMPEQILMYSDCAINPNPDAEQLAEIAIQSADSTKLFGIEPKVAMISYSTGTSGSGKDVDRVREATEIVKQKRPDITIDGPIQYDAAVIEEVARQKAPQSKVAGKANVFIFPDLNTGNALYKAVQRSANIVSIGPMLQGLRKPVNDLSRGCLVEDIVFTIALTAVQATKN